MMRWIVGTSLQYRSLVVILAAALLLFGIIQLLRNAQVDLLLPLYCRCRGFGQ